MVEKGDSWETNDLQLLFPQNLMMMLSTRRLGTWALAVKMSHGQGKGNQYIVWYLTRME